MGSQKVCRSAHTEKTATALTIYLGVCERDNRPVRFEYPLDMGPSAEIPCPECTLPVAGERMHAVTTALTCDESCRAARRPWCECGCGGINHGNVWTAGALIAQRQVVESALARYRAEQARIAQRRAARRAAEARPQRSAFGRWADGHQDLITALDPWYEHRTDQAWQSQQGGWGQHILVDFAIQAHGGWNGTPKPLTDAQAELARRILREQADNRRIRAERARQDAECAARGAGDQVQGRARRLPPRRRDLRGQGQPGVQVLAQAQPRSAAATRGPAVCQAADRKPAPADRSRDRDPLRAGVRTRG